MIEWIMLIILIVVFTCISLESEENEKDILRKIKNK